MKLTNKLKGLDSYPFHMPGHKRNDAFNIVGSNIDITEIDGFDNLHNPKDILKRLEEDIANLFGYKRSIISVNGSTCGILSAISAVSSKGDKIIIARNCHKSVYNACFLNELDVEYIEPEYDSEFCCFKSVTQESVDKAVKRFPNACAVVITSPTYEGFVSEIKCDIPLIIDAAHGAHFGLSDYLPKRACGDIVIHSLHKTLPCLTQAAVVHINNDNLYSNVKKYMDIYETSSPSYVLLSSIDRCVDFLKDCDRHFDEYKKILDDFYCFASKLNGVNILNNDDITRIVLSVDGMSGAELSEILRNDYSIEVEGSTLKYVILISSVCDTRQGFELLKSAVGNIKPDKSREISCKKPPIPEKALNFHEINTSTQADIDNCVGKICAEYIYAYPPGCPIIAPGEIIDEHITEYIRDSIKNGVNILSDSGLLPHKILTKAE